MIGFAVTGSFCTHEKALGVLAELIESGFRVKPIVSFAASSTDTRFGKAEDLIRRLSVLTGESVITTIPEAEPLGPKTPLDALIVCPCTGNTLAKLASGITDTPVTMAAKAHLRQGRPLLLALASNDAMGSNLKNIGILSEKKSVFFVPMVQDDPDKKPFSLVCDFSLCSSALEAAMHGTQLRPLFLTK